MARTLACGKARMAALTISCISVGAFLLFSNAFADAKQKRSSESVPGEFVVQLRSGISADDRAHGFESLSNRLGAKVVDVVRDNMIVVRSSKTDDDSSNRLLIRLREHPLVSIIEPNYIYRALGFRSLQTPNDPGFSYLWGLRNTAQDDSAGVPGIPGLDIGAQAAWNITTGSKSVVVAVIDTGVDFTHPDLKSQAWVNEAEANGVPGVDDDGNGLVDDINGFNFVDDNGNVTDDNAHGTHCAGTIGARGNDSKGIVGVNWDVSIMAIKFLNKDGAGTLAGAIKSIDYARQNGARILSNSWGGGKESDLLRTAIQDASDAGKLFVVAAGNETNDNDANPSFPSNYPIENVLSVGAIDNRGNYASFSNYGATTVHVAAPGVNIISTIPGGIYDSYSGTSMAAPHVSGIAALLAANNPNMTHLEIKKRIMDSARPLYTLRGRVSTAGLADAYYALSGQTPPHDPNDPARLPNVTPYTLSTDHPYLDGAELNHTIKIKGAKRLAIRFSKFETELGFDTLSIFDGTGKFVTSISGTKEDGFVSPIIYGDTAVLKFVADEVSGAYGFDIEAVLSE